MSIRNETFLVSNRLFFTFFCFDLMRFGFLCLICYIPQILSYQGLQGKNTPAQSTSRIDLFELGGDIQNCCPLV
mgnify:CR=1 FL=1